MWKREFHTFFFVEIFRLSRMFSKLAKCSFFSSPNYRIWIFAKNKLVVLRTYENKCSFQSPVVIRTVDFNNQQKLNINLISAPAFTTCSWRLLTCLWRDEGMVRILTDELSILQGNNFCRAPAQRNSNTKKPEAGSQPGHVQRFCVILEVRLSLQRSQLFGLCVQLFLS